ncbi:MAG: T9SS type A sorting domain-containing protein [Bacteroidetes bacterium]|nr:T9SS type A sorting domain-containing protein [Bacteroidota bacterium]
MKTSTFTNLFRLWSVIGAFALFGLTVQVQGQTCSLPSISSPASYNYASRQVTFSNVSLNNGGNTASVSAGSSVSLSFSWSSTQNGSYCPGCVVQLYVGIASTFTQCLTSGIHGYSASGSQNFTFTAPSTPGIYYITSTGTLDYSCQSVGVPTCGNSTLAAIKVGNPSQTATASISGESSFCPNNSAALSASVSGIFCTPSTLSYQWYFGGDPYTLGTAISGATSSTYNASSQGNYRVVVTNACGGSATSGPYFVSADNVAPTVIAKDVTIYLDANGSASLTPSMINDGSTDNCGIASYSVSKSTFNCNNANNPTNGTLTGKMTADNEFYAYLSTSASSLGTQIGYGNDWGTTYSLTSSTLTVGQDYYLHVKAIDWGSIEGLLATLNVSGSFVFANGQQTMNTNPSYWTAYNTFGGSSISPVALGSNGMSPWGLRSGISSSAQWIWRDPRNTNGGETVYFTTKITYQASTNDVNLTATDANGNSSYAVSHVTVLDNTAPTVVTQNISVTLDANGNASITSGMIDNGSSDNCGIKSMSLSKTNFTCSDLGNNTVTLTVVDNYGNSSNGTAMVTVVDNTAPTAAAQNVTIYLDANGSASTTVSAVNNGSSDNCGVSSMSLSQTSFDCNNVGNNTVTLTVTDASGNSSTATATVTVVDNTAPTVATQNVTIYLDANGSASTTASAVNNGSSDNCGVASTSLSKTSFDCSNVGNNTVTLTVTDNNGNSATGTATVTVVDNTAPTVATQNVTIYLDANGSASTSASAVNNGSSDNCGVASTSLSKTSFDCSNVGNNTVTLTVTDNNGNSATGTATVTVVDNVAPTVATQNVTIYLDANGSASTSASAVNNGSSDNCGVASTSLSKTSFDCSNVGNNSVTLTVTDDNGNSATGTATVTVVDNVAPTVATQNVTIYLDANGSASTTANAVDNSSYDNCGIASLSLSKTSFDCSNVGNNTVTLTVTDVNGNTSTGTATVTVLDNIAPTVVTKNASVTLSNGSASITTSDVNDGSYDNCSVSSVSVSPNSWNCSDIGSHTVTLTVTDVNGNTSTGTATVTVNGAVPSCTLSATPSNNTYTGAATNQMFIGYGPSSMNLSCTASGGSGFSYSWSGSNLSSSTGSTNTFTPSSGGNYSITCTVTNSNGCESTCTITICVLDIRSNNNPNNQKVYLCHKPNGNQNNAQTLSISVNAVPSHLNNHSGDKLGQCSQSCGSLKNDPVGDMYVSGNTDLIVFPNPSAGVFKFTLESESDQAVQIRVYDAMGKLVLVHEGGSSYEEIHIDGTGLAPGVYNAVVTQGEFIKTVKLTKTN